MFARILAEQLFHSLREKARHYFQEVLKRDRYDSDWSLIPSNRLFYVMLGIVKAIALYIPEWGAFGLVGIIIGYFTLKRVTG